MIALSVDPVIAERMDRNPRYLCHFANYRGFIAGPLDGMDYKRLAVLAFEYGSGLYPELQQVSLSQKLVGFQFRLFSDRGGFCS